jgi:hypothetical protein
MTDLHTDLTDERVARFLRARSSAADASLLDAIVRSAETTVQERPDVWPRLVGHRRLFLNRRLAVAAGVFALAVAVALGAGLISRSNVGDPRPTSIAPPSPASWTGPVRADATTLPVVAMADWPRETEVGGGSWDDGRDSDLPWADIVGIRYQPRDGPAQSAVNIVLGARPPRAETLPADEVISYGFVIDTNADSRADYEVGIETDAHDGGDFNVWVTDLATGITDLNAAPPYGFPVEFMHPDEVSREMAANAPEELARTMHFTFLAGSDPPGFDASSRIYAWTLVTRGGEVVAWDYAPDRAWARLPGE